MSTPTMTDNRTTTPYTLDNGEPLRIAAGAHVANHRAGRTGWLVTLTDGALTMDVPVQGPAEAQA